MMCWARRSKRGRYYFTKAQEAVKVLKQTIQSVPVLVFPDFEKPFLLEMDALKEGLRVVLSQKQDGQYDPMAFGS